MNGVEESDEERFFECQVKVTLPSRTPVVGIEFTPNVFVSRNQGSSNVLQQNLLHFTWYRKEITSFLGEDRNTCFVHSDKLATVQCTSCLTLNLPLEQSYHCSANCFIQAWKSHMLSHSRALETARAKNEAVAVATELRSCGSWCENETPSMVEQWTEVGSLKSYAPTSNDFGCILRLVSVAVDCSTGTHLSAMNIIETKPVITAPYSRPRCLVNCSLNGFDFDPKGQVAFSVLSYNVLADLYARRSKYRYCPPWALVWEYRRQKLLDEIIKYDADIICLQEVQSDHFESFFEPELAKCGYSAMYKKKTKELYTANKYIIDGCAIFYRHTLFKETAKYELEFDKIALPFVEALEPKLRSEGSFRLLKDNIALVAVLETLNNERYHDVFPSIICVANTHIHADSNVPDVKLFQVVSLINKLEEIVNPQIPLLICGDFNSLPSSDPYKFVVSGSCDLVDNEKHDPLGIFKGRKLQHSLHLASAYASFSVSVGVEDQLNKMDGETKEQLFTNFTRSFSGTLDYIFYTVNSLRVEELLELLDRESLRPGLPSPVWPSDHIALMARFSLQPPPIRLGHCLLQHPLKSFNKHHLDNLYDTCQGQLQGKPKMHEGDASLGLDLYSLALFRSLITLPNPN